MAVEVVFSLPMDWHDKDTSAFFKDCLEWVNVTFAGELLSFDVHLDESAPHAHAIILPLIDGRMKGNHLIGGTGNLMRLINLFHSDVARHYGLSRNDTKRITSKDKQSIEQLVLKRLQGDSVYQSSVWPCVRDVIHKDPLPFAQLLGIKHQQDRNKQNKSFVQIMTSKGKGKASNTI